MENKKLQRDHMIYLLRKNMDHYAGWKVTRIGFLTMLIMVSILVVSFIFIESKSFDVTKYNKGIAEFTENENIALRIYDQLNNDDIERLPDIIQDNGIPSWLRNIEIISDLNAMDHLPEDLKIQNRILTDYCQLRIKALVLIRKAIIEKSSGYDTQLKLVHMEIEKKMEEMEIQTAMDR
jgi:rhomboid protease GluP